MDHLRSTEGNASGEHLATLGLVALVGLGGFTAFGGAAESALVGNGNGTVDTGSAVALSAAAGTASEPDAEWSSTPTSTDQAGTAPPTANPASRIERFLARDSGARNLGPAAVGTITAGGSIVTGGSGGAGPRDQMEAPRWIEHVGFLNGMIGLFNAAYPGFSDDENAPWAARPGADLGAFELSDSLREHVERFGDRLGRMSDMDVATTRGEVADMLRRELAKPEAEQNPQALEFLEGVDAVLATEQSIRQNQDDLMDQLGESADALGVDGSALETRLREFRGEPAERNPDLADLSLEDIANEREEIAARIAALDAVEGRYTDEHKAEAFALAARQQALMAEQLARGMEAIDPAAALSQENLDRMDRNGGELSFPLEEFVYSDTYHMRENHPIHHDRRMHWGMDMSRTAEQKAAGILPPVGAALAGEVIGAGYEGGAGNTVTIRHDNGMQTRYLHLSEMHVQPGQRVTEGQTIGIMGSTGGSTGPHLHFELKTDASGSPVDPAPFFGLDSSDVGTTIR
ncbi:MAG: M23 family metallopeptidase [Myxococcales bacterium]|nr:M23 family metallopeptidase [Myxococcales bacterium]